MFDNNKELNNEQLEEISGGKIRYTQIIIHIKYSYVENDTLKEKTVDVIRPYRTGITTADIGREAKQYCEERGYTFITVNHSLR